MFSIPKVRRTPADLRVFPRKPSTNQIQLFVSVVQSERERKTEREKRPAEMEDITLSKTTLEQKFNCLICWGPKLRMVYGSCQHRLCENCLYDEDGKRRAGVKRCPVCCKENSFPERRPIIPEDNVEVQVQLGIRKCLYDGCGLEMWHWELFQHLM